MALIFQKFHIGFTRDIDVHAFGPPGIWRFTLWISTVSKFLMIPQQFLFSEKMHCFITFPMQDQNKKKSWFFVLWFLQTKINDSFSEEVFMLCVCPLHYLILKRIYLGMFIRVYFYMKRSDL